ncbi:hypothetical protein NPIL_517571 [Nephila pilipes]|uniref:Uncharacterized protein n=1 Tax=Nephila pilipes TaxID=299642 RepID=A0A8X6QW13_NEPPI|nr:hypothetical protein NPIL_517571 [Nephila pilipes]
MSGAVVNDNLSPRESEAEDVVNDEIYVESERKKQTDEIEKMAMDTGKTCQTQFNSNENENIYRYYDFEKDSAFCRGIIFLFIILVTVFLPIFLSLYKSDGLVISISGLMLPFTATVSVLLSLFLGCWIYTGFFTEMFMKMAVRNKLASAQANGLIALMGDVNNDRKILAYAQSAEHIRLMREENENVARRAAAETHHKIRVSASESNQRIRLREMETEERIKVLVGENNIHLRLKSEKYKQYLQQCTQNYCEEAQRSAYCESDSEEELLDDPNNAGSDIAEDSRVMEDLNSAGLDITKDSHVMEDLNSAGSDIAKEDCITEV